MRTSTKLFFLTVLGIALAGLLTGCASYVHQRPVFASSPTAIVGYERNSSTKETPVGKLLARETTSTERPSFGLSETIVGYERTSLRTFLMMGTAGKIHSLTKDGHGYSRSLSVGGIQAQGDAEAIKALGESVGIAAGAAAAEVAKRLAKP